MQRQTGELRLRGPGSKSLLLWGINAFYLRVTDPNTCGHLAEEFTGTDKSFNMRSQRLHKTREKVQSHDQEVLDNKDSFKILGNFILSRLVGRIGEEPATQLCRLHPSLPVNSILRTYFYRSTTKSYETFRC